MWANLIYGLTKLLEARPIEHRNKGDYENTRKNVAMKIKTWYFSPRKNSYTYTAYIYKLYAVITYSTLRTSSSTKLAQLLFFGGIFLVPLLFLSGNFQPVAETPVSTTPWPSYRHFLPQLLRGRPKLSKGGRSSGGDPVNQYPGMEKVPISVGEMSLGKSLKKTVGLSWGNTPFVSYQSQQILD